MVPYTVVVVVIVAAVAVARVRKQQTEKCSNLLHFHAYIVLPMLFACFLDAMAGAVAI